MIEHAVRFGEGGYLVGVQSSPAGRTPNRVRPTFIFLNSGLVHRVGPSRTYVALARRLAEQGFRTLRFDHGGIGDSGNRRDTLSFEEGGSREVVASMDYLEGENLGSSFVLVGFCSGARMALKVGAADARVVGVVSLDGQKFRTWRFWLNRYRMRGRSILSFLALRYRALSTGYPQAVSVSEVATYTMPSKEEVEDCLRELVSRGVQQHWIFTGSFPSKYNYRGQHEDAFKDVEFGKLLKVDYMPEAQHVLTSRRHQRTVVASVSDWAGSSWPARE